MRFGPHIAAILGGFLVVAVSGSVFSQSVFSGQGIGEVRPVSSARLQGMGGAGIALDDSLLLTTINPASPSMIRRTRYAISGGYRWIEVEDDFGSDPRDYAELQGAVIAVPIYRQCVVSAGLEPYTLARASWFWSRQFGDYSYEEQYQVNGGITRGLLGISFPLHRRLLVGGGVRMLFGTIEQIYTINFASSLYSDAQYINRLHSATLGLTGGLLWEVIPNWSVGAVYCSEQSGDGTGRFFYAYGDSTREIESTVDFPFTVGFGISGLVMPRVRVAGDVVWTGWEDAQPSVEGELPVADTYRIAVGLEYQPLFGGMESYYNRLYYRLGFHTENHYIENLAGDTPRLTMVSAGLGIPLTGTDRRLDIAAQFGFRGDVDDFGAKETVFGISVTLEAGEKWFMRRRR
jgi:hypothetical protein